MVLVMFTPLAAQTKPGGVSGATPAGPPSCVGDATNLFYPLDGSETLVDFCGDGASGSGPAVCPDQHNDDDSATVALPFTFGFYGNTHTSLFVNNNGNVSFGSPFSAFTASGFPVAGFPMIAPFWGDVDTGNASNPIGDVWMKLLDSDGDSLDDTLVVTWENVGHYNEQGDLRNTFQVVLSDGTNPALGLGKNVLFNYDNMCWTTGSASGGVGGFGGTPATVGVNRGDGVDFFQIGLFDHEGIDYDGPEGSNDGVSYLDGQVFCFNVSELNTPPVLVDFPAGGTVIVDASAGEIVDVDFSFLSPEPGQATSVTVSDPDGAQAAGLSIAIIAGGTATIALDWSPDCVDVGVYALSFTATDDFVPPGVTVATLFVEIICTAPMGFLRGDFDGNGVLEVAGQALALDFACGSPDFPLDCTGTVDLDAGDANDNEYFTIADFLAVEDALARIIHEA